jgi:site-specific DNA-cytosine methylase
MAKVILDLCGGTGAWSRPYAEAGYTVHNITLPDYDLMKTIFHYKDQYKWVKNQLFHFQGESSCDVWASHVYGILAAPDCAHFSYARQRAKTHRDIPGAFELVRKCREIIETCALYGNLKFWCLENPRGYLYKVLGLPAFKFERWHYGGLGGKITYLWGNFKFPKMKPKPELRDNTFIQSGCWQKIEIPSGYRQKGWDSKKIKRAITPAGFAKAFFKANR